MFHFQNNRFQSKAEFEAHLRPLVNALPLNVQLAGDDLAFATAILFRRTNAQAKIGPGIRSLHARPAPGGLGTELVLTRIDGAEDAFSWRKAVTEGTVADAAVGAMRWAVLPVVHLFKTEFFARTVEPVCELSGVQLTVANSEVDHSEPQFWAIRDQFLTGEGGAEAIVLDRNTAGVTATMADAAQLGRWLELHQQMAVLRVVSRAANRARPTGKPAAQPIISAPTPTPATDRGQVTVETGGGVVRIQFTHNRSLEGVLTAFHLEGRSHLSSRKYAGTDMFEMSALMPDSAHELVDALATEGFDVALSARDAAADGCQIRCSRRPLIVVDGQQWCQRHLDEQAKTNRLRGADVA